MSVINDTITAGQTPGPIKKKINKKNFKANIRGRLSDFEHFVFFVEYFVTRRLNQELV